MYRPTVCNGRITGYVVEFAESDACGEFHGGTDAENKANAILFERAVTAQRMNHTCDVLRPNTLVPYSDGPCDACNAERQVLSQENVTHKGDTVMPTNKTIKLHDIEGIARHSGTDEHGNVWTEFEVDYLAEQEDGECSICGAVLTAGWMCLDGGEEVCSKHVDY